MPLGIDRTIDGRSSYFANRAPATVVSIITSQAPHWGLSFNTAEKGIGVNHISQGSRTNLIVNNRPSPDYPQPRQGERRGFYLLLVRITSFRWAPPVSPPPPSPINLTPPP